MKVDATALRSACPVAASLDLFGDRWTLLILRDVLLEGRSQFAELASQESIATNILSERLQRLLCAGLLVRTRDPEDGRRWIYTPTMAAVDLLPALIELVIWGSRHTDGNAPDYVLQAINADKASLIEQMQSKAAARVLPA